MLTLILSIVTIAIIVGLCFCNGHIKKDIEDFWQGVRIGALAGIVVGFALTLVLSLVVSSHANTTIISTKSYHLKQYSDGNGDYCIEMSGTDSKNIKFNITYTDENGNYVYDELKNSFDFDFKEGEPKIEITDVDLEGVWWLFAWDFSDPYYTITVPSKDYIRY